MNTYSYSDREVWARARAVGLRAKKHRLTSSETGENLFALYSPKEKFTRCLLAPGSVIALCRQYYCRGTIRDLPPPPPPPNLRRWLDVPCVSLYA